MTQRSAQGGWAFVVILIALAIAAFLARDSLLSYFGTATRAAGAMDSRLPPGARAATDATQSTLAPAAPLERARGVEDLVQKQAEELGRRIDAADR
jgi:hypothetical protein